VLIFIGAVKKMAIPQNHLISEKSPEIKSKGHFVEHIEMRRTNQGQIL